MAALFVQHCLSPVPMVIEVDPTSPFSDAFHNIVSLQGQFPPDQIAGLRIEVVDHEFQAWVSVTTLPQLLAAAEVRVSQPADAPVSVPEVPPVAVAAASPLPQFKPPVAAEKQQSNSPTNGPTPPATTPEPQIQRKIGEPVLQVQHQPQQQQQQQASTPQQQFHQAPLQQPQVQPQPYSQQLAAPPGPVPPPYVATPPGQGALPPPYAANNTAAVPQPVASSSPVVNTYAPTEQVCIKMEDVLKAIDSNPEGAPVATIRNTLLDGYNDTLTKMIRAGLQQRATNNPAQQVSMTDVVAQVFAITRVSGKPPLPKELEDKFPNSTPLTFQATLQGALSSGKLAYAARGDGTRGLVVSKTSDAKKKETIEAVPKKKPKESRVKEVVVERIVSVRPSRNPKEIVVHSFSHQKPNWALSDAELRTLLGTLSLKMMALAHHCKKGNPIPPDDFTFDERFSAYQSVDRLFTALFKAMASPDTPKEQERMERLGGEALDELLIRDAIASSRNDQGLQMLRISHAELNKMAPFFLSDNSNGSCARLLETMRFLKWGNDIPKLDLRLYNPANEVCRAWLPNVVLCCFTTGLPPAQDVRPANFEATVDKLVGLGYLVRVQVQESNGNKRMCLALTEDSVRYAPEELRLGNDPVKGTNKKSGGKGDDKRPRSPTWTPAEELQEKRARQERR